MHSETIVGKIVGEFWARGIVDYAFSFMHTSRGRVCTQAPVMHYYRVSSLEQTFENQLRDT